MLIFSSQQALLWTQNEPLDSEPMEMKHPIFIIMRAEKFFTLVLCECVLRVTHPRKQHSLGVFNYSPVQEGF